jgi:cold shock CspA family protein
MLINNSEVQAGQDQVGVVKWFDTKSGVGVIISRNTGAEVFVHFSSIKGKTKSLTPGQIVTFTAVGTDKGLRTLIVNTK